MQLLQSLSAAGTTLSSHLELAHVFAITLNLLLLGIDTASCEFRTETGSAGAALQ